MSMYFCSIVAAIWTSIPSAPSHLGSLGKSRHDEAHGLGTHRMVGPVQPHGRHPVRQVCEFGLAFDNGYEARPGIHIDFGGDRLELRSFLARSTRFGEQEGLAIGRASYAFGDSRSTVTPGDHFATVGFNLLGNGVGNEQGMGA